MKNKLTILNSIDFNVKALYVNKEGKFDITYPNQQKAMKNIIEHFLNKFNWVLLLAEMQSGKTGTFLGVLQILKNNPSLLKTLGIEVDNFYLFTGMNETKLLDQFRSDMNEFIGLKNNIYGNSRMRTLITDNTTVWKNARAKMGKNSVFIIDESDFAGNKRSTLDKFFKKMGINQINGVNPNNIYVISVSATPFAEVNQIINTTKEKVKLENDNKYYGIQKMFANNKIKPALNFGSNRNANKEVIKEFVNLITTKYKNKSGYIIIRLAGENVKTQLKKQLTKNIPPIVFHDYDSKNIEQLAYNKFYEKEDESDINIQYFNNKPKGVEVIFIKSMLRAGKRINTENILMIHDTPIINKSDVTVQSLLGRCCGYNKNQNVDVYVNLKAAEGYVKALESNFTDIPTGKNTTKVIELKEGFSLKSTKVPLLIKGNTKLFKDLDNEANNITKREILQEFIDNSLGKQKTKHFGKILGTNKITGNTPPTASKKLWLDPLNALNNNKKFILNVGSGVINNENKFTDGDNVYSINYNHVSKELLLQFGKVVYSDELVTKTVVSNNSHFVK